MKNCRYEYIPINLKGIINIYLLSERTHLSHGRSSGRQVLTTVMQGRVFIPIALEMVTEEELIISRERG